MESLATFLTLNQIKSNHILGVVQQLPFNTRETTSQNPNINGVFSLTNPTSEKGRKSRDTRPNLSHDASTRPPPNIKRQTIFTNNLEFFGKFRKVYMLLAKRVKKSVNNMGSYMDI